MRGCTNPNQRGGYLPYLLCVIVGIVICICPGNTLIIICRVGGFLALAFGVWRLLLFVKKR